MLPREPWFLLLWCKLWSHLGWKSPPRSSSQIIKSDGQPSTAKSKSKYCSVYNCMLFVAWSLKSLRMPGQCEWMVWAQPRVSDCGFPAPRTRVENTQWCLLIQQWKLFIKICLTPWRLPVLWGNQNCGAKGLSAACWNGLMYLNCDEWSPGGKSARWCIGKEYLLVYKLSLQTARGFIPGLKKMAHLLLQCVACHSEMGGKAETFVSWSPCDLYSLHWEFLTVWCGKWFLSPG